MKHILCIVLLFVLLATHTIALSACQTPEQLDREAAKDRLAVAEEILPVSDGVFELFLARRTEVSAELQENYRETGFIRTSYKYESPWGRTWVHKTYVEEYGIDPAAGYNLRGGRLHPLYDIYDIGMPISFLSTATWPDVLSTDAYVTTVATSDSDGGSLCGVRVGDDVETAIRAMEEYGFAFQNSVTDTEASAYIIRLQTGDRTEIFALDAPSEEYALMVANVMATDAYDAEGDYTVECVGYQYELRCKKDGVCCSFWYDADGNVTHISLCVYTSNREGVVID